MEMEEDNGLNYTERCLRIFHYAELQARESTKVVYPVTLLLGILQDRTGVCAELHSK